MGASSGEFRGQQRLLEALSDPARYPWPVERVERIETHISTVLLAGEFVCKFKKPLNPGFLDFTTLARRRHFCEEEIRLNGRLAPDHYLRVLPVGGTVDDPVLDREPAIEYAVLMRRFPQSALMDRLQEEGRLPPQVMDRLAETVAEFHRSLPAAEPGSPHGSFEAVAQPMRDNFAQFDPSGVEADGAAVTALSDWTGAELSRLRGVIVERRAGGCVRECHGDLHLANIAWLDGRVLIFDGIEFDPALRWIDVINEIAFAVMDLDYRGAAEHRHRLLNTYLEHTGDYGGMRLLRLYAAYRAMVRAKITALRAGQYEDSEPEKSEAQRAARRYLALADGYRNPPGASLTITCGLSGSGKSTVAGERVAHRGLIRLRSDVERKRLFGLAPDERGGESLYTAEANRRTYERLRELARELLADGWPVIIDAAFLKRSGRDSFRALADECGCPFRILHTRAAPDALRQRVQQRASAGSDVSDADLAVLEGQLQSAELPGADESDVTEIVDTGADR